VQKVWTLSAEHPVELRESAQVSPWADRPPEMLEVDELDARLLRRFPDEGASVRADDDVVLAGERRQERGDVSLRASHFAERHEYEDS